MPSHDEIIQQQDLLRVHRLTLFHYLQQRAKLGDAYIPPGVIHGIVEARDYIKHIKSTLRNWGVTVLDHPDDAEERVVGSALSHPKYEESTFFTQSVSDYMSQLRRKVERLTQDQFRVIQMLKGERRVCISGSAGSGKTLVAAEKAIRLARAGLQTLFLCHNPLLANHVARLTGGSGVLVLPFGAWIGQLANEHELGHESDWSVYAEPDVVQLGAAFDTVIDVGPRYDAIIVDEGQDFRDEWWMVVEAALVSIEASILYIFHDDYQALLPYRSKYPIHGPTLDLSRNCRNAGQIYQLMRHLQPASPAPEAELTRDGTVKIINYTLGVEQEGVSRAIQWIHHVLPTENIVILFGGTQSVQTSSLVNANFTMTQIVDWQEAIRKQFMLVISNPISIGVQLPAEGEEWILQQLKQLSLEPFPTSQDIELVHRVACKFTVDRGTRQKTLENAKTHNALKWHGSEEALYLRRAGMRTHPISAAEYLLHFERDDWTIGLPQPKVVTLRPYYEGGEKGIIRMYDLATYKGLEADAVILIVAGRVVHIEQLIYVGISRARFILAALVDKSTAQFLPQ